MLTVGVLKKKLSEIPDDAQCFGYEGEVTGLTVEHRDGRHWFITAHPEVDRDDDRTPIEAYGRPWG